MIKFRNKKGGFSIAEAVIALAVIVIVTASALTLITSATTARYKAIKKSEAINCANDLLECFKVSNDESEFESNAEFAGYTRTNDFKEYITEITDIDFSNGSILITVYTADKENKLVEIEYSKYVHSTETSEEESNTKDITEVSTEEITSSTESVSTETLEVEDTIKEEEEV